MDNVADDEEILTTLYSVAAHQGGLFSRVKECMLCLTNKRIAVIYKTEMNHNKWQKAFDEQKEAFKRGDNDTIRKSSYTIEDLNSDLDLEDNLSIPFENIIELKKEEKRWAQELRIIFKEKKKRAKSLNFVIVRSWIRYPFPDPLEYEKAPDWDKFIEVARSYMQN